MRPRYTLEMTLCPAALLLDMDGTLTEPMLDFAAIKAEMGIGSEAILEAMSRMAAGELARAETILLRHESRAAEQSTLSAGCASLLEWAAGHGVPTALITRNSRQSLEVFCRRHTLCFHTCISRDDCTPKPDPTPLRLACERLGVASADAWMVGDGRFDIEAGHAAGLRTVWLSLGRRRSFPAVPWREVADLPALVELLNSSLAGDLSLP